MSDLDYTGRRVVVTGGATGVGAALLELLAELGAGDVTVLDVKPPTGPHKAFLETDLSDKARVDAAIAELAGRPVDALFNNAGVADTLPPETVFKVNALAVRHLSESLLPHVSAGGAIVNTASIAGGQWPSRLQAILELLATDGWDAGLEWFVAQDLGIDTYSFTKEVAQVFTMQFSRVAAARGVRVNSVCPSPIDTPLLPDFRKTMSDRVIDWCVKEAGGRLVTPREVAACLAWLGSPASSFVSGVNLNVDMGFSAAMVTGQLDFSGLGTD
jgi:NAD(P)-dependent dehydrogenase (short-subunit alcohol dehydrogenase family)